MRESRSSLYELKSNGEPREPGEELFRKVYVNHVEDLPKDNRTYIVHDKKRDYMTRASFSVSVDSALRSFWLNRVDWYLLPLTPKITSRK